MPWLSRSSNLKPLDFFLQGYLKFKIYLWILMIKGIKNQKIVDKSIELFEEKLRKLLKNDE